MKKYNFDQIINRKNTSSVKWSGNDDEIPMWIADMDFETLPEVKEAILSKASIGAYGYTYVPYEYFTAYRKWWEEVHNVSFKEEWMIFSNGIVAAISSIIRKITNVGDSIVIQAPVYNCFYSSIKNNNRNVLTNDLICKDNEYYIDYVDLEEKLSKEETKVFILCNPHNPVGKMWEKEDLIKIGNLCLKYNVLVISDEIHCDFVDPGLNYVPFGSISREFLNNSITCISTSKTFNLAGIQGSCIVVPNSDLFKRVSEGISVDCVGEINYFSAEANIAALTYGKTWVKELNEYIYDNKEFVRKFIKDNNLDVKVINSNSTYFLWIDVSEFTCDADAYTDFLRKEVGVYFCSGLKYGEPGRTFLRMNLATPKYYVVEAMNRLLKVWKR